MTGGENRASRRLQGHGTAAGERDPRASCPGAMGERRAVGRAARRRPADRARPARLRGGAATRGRGGVSARRGDPPSATRPAARGRAAGGGCRRAARGGRSRRTRPGAAPVAGLPAASPGEAPRPWTAHARQAWALERSAASSSPRPGEDRVSCPRPAPGDPRSTPPRRPASTSCRRRVLPGPMSTAVVSALAGLVAASLVLGIGPNPEIAFVLQASGVGVLFGGAYGLMRKRGASDFELGISTTLGGLVGAVVGALLVLAEVLH